ncbi:MAG: hypothetical protein ACOVSR_16355 [Bacteroidia bacterium]|jgi:hypothetical protein
MEPLVKKILNYISIENTKELFNCIKPDFSNLDEVYQNNLNQWFYNNSDKKEIKDTKDIKETKYGIFTENNNITISKTKGGFELTEIDFINDQIKYINKLDFESLTFAEKKQFETYKSFLLNKQNPPQQVENVKPDEVKKELYNHIFKDNAFEVFEKYHTTKNLAENCKTDLNLLFQLFKKDNLFLETVELKHYIKWLNSTYNYSLIELKRVDIKTRPNIQRTNDYKEYKKSTLNKP